MIISSCTKYPATSDRLLEDLVVLTQYDVKTNFGLYKTFSIVDQIPYIKDNDSGYVTNPNAQAILDRISQNMIARGFTQVAHTANPDLGINVSVVEVTNVSVYYPGWYWGYPGYYPPDWWGYSGYGYYYPYYPVYYTSYTSGTLIIDMVNFKDLTPDNKIPVCWNAFIRALLTGTHTISDFNTAIDQAFTQTPQIKTSL
jgi:hypothetical protein